MIAFYLSTVDIHIIRILLTLARLRPVITVHAVILACHPALLACNGAVHQHPAGVCLALLHAGPGGTPPGINICASHRSVSLTYLFVSTHVGFTQGFSVGFGFDPDAPEPT